MQHVDHSVSEKVEPRLGRSVSIEQAATQLNVSRRTVYNRIRDGRLQTIRTLGGSQRVLLASLEDDRLRAVWGKPVEHVEPERQEPLKFVSRRVSV